MSCLMDGGISRICDIDAGASPSVLSCWRPSAQIVQGHYTMGIYQTVSLFKTLGSNPNSGSLRYDLDSES